MHYLHLSTRKALLQTTLQTLLATHVDAIIEKGFNDLMEQNRLEDLTCMYSLYAHVDTLPKLRQVNTQARRRRVPCPARPALSYSLVGACTLAAGIRGVHQADRDGHGQRRGARARPRAGFAAVQGEARSHPDDRVQLERAVWSLAQGGLRVLYQRQTGVALASRRLPCCGAALPVPCPCLARALPVPCPCLQLCPALASSHTRKSWWTARAPQNRAAELVARFIDAKLRSGNKGTSEEELEEVLDKTMTLFRYIDGKVNAKRCSSSAHALSPQTADGAPHVGALLLTCTGHV